MVDYSKWDSIDTDDDDNDDGQNNNSHVSQSCSPIVTRLSAPSRVTIPGKDDTLEHVKIPSLHTQPLNFKDLPVENNKYGKLDYSKWDQVLVDEEDEEEPREYYEKEWYENSVREQRERESKESKQVLPSLSSHRSEVNNASFVANGGEERDFLWSQTNKEVFIRVPINCNIKAKRVDVNLNSNGTIKVSVDSKVVFQRLLWMDVWGASPTVPAPLGTTKTEEFAFEMEWEIIDLPETLQRTEEYMSKCVSISLHKMLPNDLIKAVWWERAFKDGDETSIQLAQEQKAHSKAFKDAWQEAHAVFREKLKKDHGVGS